MKQPLADWIAERYTRIDRRTVIKRFEMGLYPGYRLVREGRRMYVVEDCKALEILEALCA